MEEKEKGDLIAHYLEAYHFTLIGIPHGIKGPPKMKGWQNFDDGQAHEVNNGDNIGVVLGSHVVNLDFETEDGIKKYFGEQNDDTLVTKTGKGNHVFYSYEGEQLEPEQYFDEDGKLIAELRTGKQYTTLPPSLHPSGKFYETENLPVALIPFDKKKHEERMVKIGKPRTKITKEVEKEKQRVRFENSGDDLFTTVKSRVKISDVQRLLGAEVGDRVACPIHGTSETHKTPFAVYDHDSFAKCWSEQCRFAGDAITLYAKARNVKNIEAAKELAERFCIPEPKSIYSKIQDLVALEEREKKKVGLLINQELVEEVSKRFNFIAFRDTEEVYYYSEGIFVPGGEGVIKEQCQRIMKTAGYPQRLSSHTCNEIIFKIMTTHYVEREEYESSPELLCVENGVLNLLTGEFSSHGPQFKQITKCLMKYDPNAAAPVFEKFLSEIVRADDIPMVHEMFGYCLYRAYPHHKAFLFVGEGANGKSTLIEVLRQLLGVNNCVNISIQELEASRFSKGSLYGKMANLCPDLSAKALKTTGTFKMLVGGDAVTVDKKFKDMFTFLNYAKLIYSANQFPEVDDDTYAFWRRWVFLTFPKRFEGKAADKTLPAKLSTSTELSGVLNLAINGLRRMLENGTFSNEMTVEQIREFYIRQSDSVGAFVLDQVEVSPDSFITKKKLLATYQEYCRSKKYPPAAQEKFFRKFPEKVRVEEDRRRIDGKQERCYVGIKLLIEDENPAGQGVLVNETP